MSFFIGAIILKLITWWLWGYAERDVSGILGLIVSVIGYTAIVSLIMGVIALF